MERFVWTTSLVQVAQVDFRLGLHAERGNRVFTHEMLCWFQIELDHQPFCNAEKPGR